MKPLSGLNLAVAGAGVFGLAIASSCVEQGADVQIFEPRAFGVNASGVAAGMLAPAFEALLDQTPAERYGPFQQAYAAWLAFAGNVLKDMPSDLTSGTVYVGSVDEVSALSGRLASFGVRSTLLTGEAVRALQPRLRRDIEAAIRVAGEGRLDPVAVLAGLDARFRGLGGVWRREGLGPEHVGAFDAVVLAAGFQTRAWASQVPELSALGAIKGHVLHFAGGPTSGPVIRSAQGYAAPQRAGVVFGATMEAGRFDDDIDPDKVRMLLRAASTLIPDLAETPFVARTGVRASTPDGWPMIGRTVSGLYVATGARRNGWLLAPLVAEAMVEALQGSAPREGFDPGRFGRGEAVTNA